MDLIGNKDVFLSCLFVFSILVLLLFLYLSLSVSLLLAELLRLSTSVIIIISMVLWAHVLGHYYFTSTFGQKACYSILLLSSSHTLRGIAFQLFAV